MLRSSSRLAANQGDSLFAGRPSRARNFARRFTAGRFVSSSRAIAVTLYPGSAHSLVRRHNRSSGHSRSVLGIGSSVRSGVATFGPAGMWMIQVKEALSGREIARPDGRVQRGGFATGE
jgi:hypothetical protein